MSKSVDTLFWSSLGKKGPLLFGEECASAALWMFLALLQRCVLLLLRIEPYVPTGIIFAFPLLLQVFNFDLKVIYHRIFNASTSITFQFVGKHVPFLRENYPVLPVRIAEGIMGTKILFTI